MCSSTLLWFYYSKQIIFSYKSLGGHSLFKRNFEYANDIKDAIMWSWDYGIYKKIYNDEFTG